VLLVNCLPVLLRPTVSEDFIVAGSGFFQGIMNEEALLVPIPSLWLMKVIKTYLVRDGQITSLNLKTRNDPRLPCLPWGEVGRDIHGYATSAGIFRSTVTGVTMDSDPRMLPNCTGNTRYRVEWFRLV
jgi:hypothetical protein